MASGSHWLRLCFLLFGCFLLEAERPYWMSKTNLCDVKVTNDTNDIIFFCNRRKLKEVPGDIGINATVLLLGENRITNISNKSFHHLTKLRNLDIGWLNQGRDINMTNDTFSSLANLLELVLDGNALQQIPDELPPGLLKLYLRRNHISSVTKSSFSNLKNITEIYLSFNCYYWIPCYTNMVIENGSFQNLTNLRVLSLGYNNLTHVPHRLPESIETLDLSSNSIQNITRDDFRELTKLQVLDLQGNCPRCLNAPFPCIPCPKGSIKIHPEAFSSLTSLKSLQLSGNSLHFIENSWFQSLTNLQNLFLSFNFLAGAIEVDGGFLTHLSRLEKIDLSYNFELREYPFTVRLSQNFSKLVSLKCLHLEGYVFREIKNYSLESLYNLKNLSVLNLGTNFIVRTDSLVFTKFHNLKITYLSENRFFPVSFNTQTEYGVGSSHISFSPTPKMYDFGLSHPLVKHACYITGRVLDLSSNNLFFITPKQFEDFGNISCLNLSNNGFTAALNGSQFSTIPDLKYLDLSNNKIDLAYDNAFQELKNLEVLDLSSNSHYFTVSGVTHNLNFLENLPELKVLNLSHNRIFTLTSKKLKSNSLLELQFQGNLLKTLWKEQDKSYYELFKNLVNLTYLDISHNCLEKIPQKVFENLPLNMTVLRINHNNLKNFMWTDLSRYKKLKILDLSHNSLTHVSENISAITSLKVLKLNNNKISHLSDGLLNNATSLEVLYLSHNQLTIINQSTFMTWRTRNLKYLHLDGNPFHCTCDILEFILWLKTTDVIVPSLPTKVNCHMPLQLKDEALITFDIDQCVNDNEAFLIYSLSTTLVIWFIVIAVAMHLFYWDASYIFHYWKAKIKGYYYLSSTGNVYDAFVTYDTKDPYVSDWVLNHLRVQLEECGEKALPICLEERDWDPGSAVIDNLSQSIWQSRKTVFVLTEEYVRSGGFRIAIYLAHQRLLDDDVDVIVLLLLEPVLRHSHFLRLRRRLCPNTVLDWPQNPSAEPWFWQCLQNAIRVDNQVLYSKLYSRYFTTK